MTTRRLLGVVAALMLTAAVASGCSDSSAPEQHAAAASPVAHVASRIQAGVGVTPDSFVADVNQHQLGIYSASTGRKIRSLIPNPYGHLTVDTSAVDRSGRIWVTLERGWNCSDPINDCGETPRCAGKVIVLNPTTGAVRTVLRVPTNDLIADAQPSPDGRYLAYLDSRCDRPGNKYIRVQDLTTGRSWTIGAGLRPCDFLGSLSWTSDGRHLVTAYGRSLVSRAQLGDYWGLDRCLAPAPAGFRVVPALRGQPRVDGPSAAVQKDCSLVAVTVAVKGYAAIEACPYPHDMWSGPVRLLSYSPQLRRSVVATLGSCYNGAQLRANAAGTALGWTGLRCGQPHSVVEFTVRRHRLMVFRRLPIGYWGSLSAVSW